MGGKYQVYSEYKDSGHRFVGEIPGRWTRRIVGSLSDVIDPQPDHRAPAICNDGQGFPYIGIRDVNKDGTLNFETARPVEESAVIKQEVSFTIEPNNIVFCKVGTLGIPRIVVPHGRCALSATLVLIKVNKDFNSQYMLYALASNVVTSQTNYLATGSTRAALGIQQIRKFQIPVPPLDQQEKIANFLDHETAKIDTLIEKQQQLIKLLEEKRQAVISHAVTKGLNPNALMRDSGVEWLGEVPEHWNISKVKYLAELTPKKTEVEALKNKTCSFIPMEKLKKDLLILDETRQISQVFDGYTYFKDEDLLVAKVTPCFENKNMVVARGLHNGVGFGSSEIYVLRPNLESLNDFLYYRLQEDILMEMATGAMTGAGGLKRVPSVFLNNVQLALPPMKERLEIVEYIRGYVSKFDNLMKNSEYVIKLMQERRTALISAAVTGKIDVRNWQALQPSNKSNNNTGK